jgi:Ca-activated chloride channel family protein
MRRGLCSILRRLPVAAVMLWAAPAAAFDLFVSENGDVAEGNERLAAGEHAAALAAYDAAARALPGRAEVHLNRGLALSRMGDEQLDQAMQAWKLAVESGGTDGMRARALRNLGDAFFRKEDYKAAIDHYRKSLMAAPGNRDVAWNLEVARQRLKEQEEQKQEQDQQEQDQQDQQEQDQQEQDQQDRQDQQEQDQQDRQDQQDQDQQEQREPDRQQEQEQRQEQPPPTKQELEQILDSLDRSDDNLFKQQARQRAVRVPAGAVKDW